ncbi:MAG TPA: DedA family protein [Nitrososphaerales archaeon]|nr:DedA family protein [Nitrososphaerales archaeon]
MGDPGFPRRTNSLVPRNKYLAVVAIAALCLSLVELVDLFELPLESYLGGAAASGSFFSVSALTSFLDIGYAGLFILMTMESSALPIPSEVVLPLAGYLAYLGKMNLGLALVDATLAGLAGSLISYYLGLKLGRPVVYRLLGRVGVSPKRLDDGERWVDSKGAWSVFIGRFIPGVRSVISIPAGILRMELRPFVVLTVVGTFVWSAALIYVGYSAGPLWEGALSTLSMFADQAALVVIAGVSVIYVAYYLGALGQKG